MARVRLEGIGKRYRGADVLQDLDLEFADGEFTCVLGPSGCGKSTILKLIAGIEEVTSGRILFDDDDVTHRTPERRDIAMVFQTYGLYPNMTARGNIAFPLKLRKMPRAEQDARVEEVAEQLGILGVLDRPPRMLSGGERQRVALARAIVRQPRVFLLDEPISNLDAHLRATTREELKRIHARLGATFIYVTHDQDDAEAMGDRVVLMSRGKVQQVDTPSRVYHRPANRFVASFVGRLPMNQVVGTIVEEADRTWFESGALRFALGPFEAPDRPPTGRVLLGVRPEAVTALPPGSGSGDPVGSVTLTEVVAPDEYAQVRVGEVLIRARVPEETPVTVGQQVRLVVNRARLHFFDVETEQRIEGLAPVPAAPTAPQPAVPG
ncbi:MAG: ABC transporter ATP-binding protein [Chloroflexi bacterium]|nr:ABC transporter ATP-binding protein [Chloroflexota bacterium]